RQKWKISHLLCDSRNIVIARRQDYPTIGTQGLKQFVGARNGDFLCLTLGCDLLRDQAYRRAVSTFVQINPLEPGEIDLSIEYRCTLGANQNRNDRLGIVPFLVTGERGDQFAMEVAIRVKSFVGEQR